MVPYKDAQLPVRRVIDLSDLTVAGSVIEFSADAEELIRIAAWADLVSVSHFGANVTIHKLSTTHFALHAELEAVVEQRCVVTLEPLCATVTFTLDRELHYTDRPVESEGELTLTAGDDEVPDVIDDLHYDYCAPLLEEFSLNLDPYPRKGGVNYISPDAGGERAESPFAVLAQLKKADQT